jgi:N-acetyl sugar amidotransferase
MDSTVSGWELTSQGCNYCDEFTKNIGIRTTSQNQIKNDFSNRNLYGFVEKIRSKKTISSYDCVFGLSGGLDSCFALHLVCSLGLNPLVVHMDNGWDSELAQSNIENMINKLGVDYVSYVINWNEYRDMQLAFFEADVVDIEMLYDQAASAVCYKFAREHKLKVLIGGLNSNSEGIKQPETWSTLDKLDSKNIKGIINSSKQVIKKVNYPFYSKKQFIVDTFLYRIKWYSILDLINYDLKDAKKILITKYDFKPYPYKHYESIFTRFYQGYILPNKFNVDKRKIHLSSLIINGQMDRDTALNQLKENPYSSEVDLKKDYDYVIKKLGLTEKTFNEYIKRQPKSHLNYPNSRFSYKYIFLPLLAINRFIIADKPFMEKLKWLTRRVLYLDALKFFKL